MSYFVFHVHFIILVYFCVFCILIYCHAYINLFEHEGDHLYEHLYGHLFEHLYEYGQPPSDDDAAVARCAVRHDVRGVCKQVFVNVFVKVL